MKGTLQRPIDAAISDSATFGISLETIFHPNPKNSENDSQLPINYTWDIYFIQKQLPHKTKASVPVYWLYSACIILKSLQKFSLLCLFVNFNAIFLSAHWAPLCYHYTLFSMINFEYYYGLIYSSDYWSITVYGEFHSDTGKCRLNHSNSVILSSD